MKGVKRERSIFSVVDFSLYGKGVLKEDALLLLAVVFGIALRVRHLLLNRPLWLDEAFIAVTVIQRPLHALFVLPLPYEQTPPPLFLLFVKVLAIAFGPSELVLRIVPFVSGCLSLCLFPLLRHRHSKQCLVIGTWLLAVAYGGVYYSAELKQYSVEALLTVMYLLAGMSLLRQKYSKKSLFSLIFFAVVGPWIGFSAIFMMFGLLSGIIYKSFVEKKCVSSATLTVCLVGMFSFMVMYVTYARPASSTQYRMDYWRECFAPLPLTFHAMAWYYERVGQVVGHFFGLTTTWKGIILATLAMVGAGSSIRRDAPWGIVLVIPFLGVLILSLLGRFPSHERLLVFLLPIVCLLIAEGALLSGLAVARVALRGNAVPACLIFLLLVPTVVRMIVDPSIFERQEFKQIYEGVLARRTKEDTVFVFQTATPALLYYSRLDKRLAGFVPVYIVRGDQASLEQAINTVKEAGRGWVLFTHRLGRDESEFTEAFEKDSAITDRLNAKGAWTFSFCYGAACGESSGHERRD